MKTLRHIHWAALLSLALSLACTGPTTTTTSTEDHKQPCNDPEPRMPEPVTTANPPVDPPPEPPVPPVDGFFMAAGAPQPRACTSASECLGDTIPDVVNPCCQDPYSLEPHARAYREWVYAWRKDNCASVTCPPPPAPAQPPPCHFEVDCVRGQCVDSCAG